MRGHVATGTRVLAAAALLGVAACATAPSGEADGAIALLAYAAEGGVLAAARAGENAISILDAQTLVERRVLSGASNGAGVRHAARSLRISRDGSRLAAAGIDDTVIVWDVASGAELFREATLQGVRDAALSPDGTLVAAAGPGRVASVWRVADRQRVAELRGHFDEVTAIAFSHGGDTIATGGADRTVRLWSLAGPAPVTLPEWHRAAVTQLEFSPDDTLLAVSAQLLNLWRVADRRSLAHALEPAEPTPVPPEAQALAAVLMIIASARSMQLGGGPLGVPPIGGVASYGPAGSDLQVAFSPDGRLLAVLRRASPASGTGEVLIAEVAGNRVTRIPCRCFAFAFRPDGRAIATAGDRIRLWNPDTGEPLGAAPGR